MLCFTGFLVKVTWWEKGMSDWHVIQLATRLLAAAAVLSPYLPLYRRHPPSGPLPAFLAPFPSPAALGIELSWVQLHRACDLPHPNNIPCPYQPRGRLTASARSHSVASNRHLDPHQNVRVSSAVSSSRKVVNGSADFPPPRVTRVVWRAQVGSSVTQY